MISCNVKGMDSVQKLSSKTHRSESRRSLPELPRVRAPSGRPPQQVIRHARRRQSVIERVLLPEKFGYELTEVAPDAEDFDDVHNAMCNSLSWRAPTAISDATKAFVSRQLPKKNDVSGDVLLDTLVAVAVIPSHPLNADYLHEILSDSMMPDRDAWWSTYLFRMSGHQGSVQRLIDWAWKHSDQWTGSDEVASLAGTMLAWFLTCSHRKVRDGATKGLVRLFERRLHLLKPLLERFANVDDPYVSERLAATAFGAAVRSNDTHALAELAKHIYDFHFAKTDPPAHFLERDYLRQTVEVALERGISLDVNLDRLRPPYSSRWPDDKDIPSWESDGELRSSMYGDYLFNSYGDFAKYVTDFSEWTARRLDGLSARTPEQEFKVFQSVAVYSVKLVVLEIGKSVITLLWMWNHSSRMSPKARFKSSDWSASSRHSKS